MKVKSSKIQLLAKQCYTLKCCTFKLKINFLVLPQEHFCGTLNKS